MSGQQIHYVCTRDKFIFDPAHAKFSCAPPDSLIAHFYTQFHGSHEVSLLHRWSTRMTTHLPSRSAAPPSMTVFTKMPSFSRPASAPTPIPMILIPRPSSSANTQSGRLNKGKHVCVCHQMWMMRCGAPLSCLCCNGFPGNKLTSASSPNWLRERLSEGWMGILYVYTNRQ